jgi:putative ABC transport system permease protein
MSETALPARNARTGGSAFALALREMRAGLKGFYIFLACIALGVATIAGIGSLASAIESGLAREGRTILGGDLAFSLAQREATTAERDFLAAQGDVGEVATLRAMARRIDGSDQALVELKAVDGTYPLTGEVLLRSDRPVQAVLDEAADAAPALVDETLLVRLGLDIGDAFELGRGRFRVADIITREPDRLSDGADFGPRITVALPALRESGLLQPGSLVRWHYRVSLPEGARSDADLARLRAEAETLFPESGFRIRSRENAAPGLERAIDRFSQFLSLVGLTALIVGGVGVANAVRALIDEKRATIATLKALGATGGFVFRLYLMQVMLVALIGTLIGVAVGALVPPLANVALAEILPVATGGLYPGRLAIGAAFGLLVAAAFALWPLGRAREVPVAALFRDLVAPDRRRPRWPILAAVAVVLAGLVALALILAEVPRIAAIYLGAAAGAFVLLRLVASGIEAIARRLPRARSTALRLAIANIHRPGALTPSVVLSLGLGLTLIVALALIEGNLSRQLTTALPERAPSFFFLDIQRAERDAFVSLLNREAPEGVVETVPMLRGRIVSLKGIPAEDYPAPPEARWVLSGDRGVTYSETLPEDSRVTEGEWWPADHAGPPLVSFAEEEGRELGLAVGDAITVNVLGRNIEAEIANFRAVDWSSLGINFVMVFSPDTFAGAPHTSLATLTMPGATENARELDVLRAVTNAFPAVTSVRVKDALEAVNRLIGQLNLAIRGASGVTLAASILVLAGALAAGHRSRIKDAVILKTLGATRARLLLAYGLEYVLLGLATAVFGVLAGTLAAYGVLVHVMDIDFVFLPRGALVAALGALLLTVGLGIAGTWRVLGARPARVLRSL